MLVSKSKFFQYEAIPRAFQNDDAYSVPLQQTYEPANAYSLTLDHDYFAVSPEDQYLADSKVTQISEDERKSVETAAQAQSSCRAWKQERCEQLHSSHFVTICKAKRDNRFRQACISPYY